MTTQSPNGRYQVFSADTYRNYPDAVPACRYNSLLDAIRHANSVNYHMGIIDSLAESRGFVYTNQQDGLSQAAKSRMSAMVKAVLAAR